VPSLTALAGFFARPPMQAMSEAANN